MVKNYNAKWIEKDGRYGVSIKSYFAFPFDKSWKFLQEDGISNSISSFYEISANLDNTMDKHQEKFGVNSKKDSKEQPKSWCKFW